MKKNAVLLFFALLLFPALCSAQGLGSIVGTVTDPSGSSVGSATVTVTDVGTGFVRTAVTNADGYYVVASLRPSKYSVAVEATGFSTSKQAVTVLADQSLTVNMKLALGATTETVTVTGNDLQVDTTTSTVKQVIEQQRISELPLNGRNAAQLTLLVPGAVSATNGGADQGATKTFPGAVTISANGARQDMVSYQLDGGNYVDEYTNVNQPFPFPDALQEFSVQTSNYSAEYGQNAGAVVNVVTKSGTNSFHGDVFEYLRNAVFNARGFFAPVTLPDKGRDQLKRNQFGGTIGGPIIHDKTFFFAGYQGTRQRNVGGATNRTVPSQADINNFTAGGGVIDPTIQNLLTYLPIQPTSNSVTFVRPDHQDYNEVLGRVDHLFSQNDRLAVRYDYNHFSKAAVFQPTNILSYADGSKITNQNYLIHETHIFRPTFINDFRFSYAREKSSRGPDPSVPSVQTLGSMIPFQPNGVNAIQQIRVNGYFSFGDNPPAAFVRNNFTWSDDISWIKGNHEFRFGGIIERSRVDIDNLFFQPAEFSFPGLDAFLSGLLGDYSNNFAFRQGAGEFKNNRNIFAGIYIQDNYKVTRRLTLNLGLRYEPALPWREIKGRVQQFRIDGLMANLRSTVFPNAPPGVYFPGDPGVPPNGINATLNMFMPRVGFAYDLFGDGKTSLRGGAGIFGDTRITGIINNRFVDQAPFSPQLVLSTGVVNPGTITDPLCTQANTQAIANAAGVPCSPQPNIFPAPYPPPSDSMFAPGSLYLSWDSANKYQVPTVYNWNLSVEHQFPSNILVRAGYVGSRSTHLTETLNLNPAPFSSTGTKGTLRLNTIAANLGLPNNLYAQIQQDSQDINSMYHSLQLSAERRMGRGLTILANYTWSKSMDDAPANDGITGFGTSSARPWDDPLRHQFDYGPSDFDHTHRFVASFVWETPAFSHSNGWLKTILGGWQYSGIVTAQTGRPFTVLQGAELSGTGLGQDRGTLLSGVDPYLHLAPCPTTKACVSLLNKAAFDSVANTKGTYGATGKNAFRLPGKYNWDMGLAKSFTFTERWRLQFKAEFFNAFNRVNFFDEDQNVGEGQPSLGNTQKLNAGAFGTLTGSQVGNPRIGQLALKLFF